MDPLILGALVALATILVLFSGVFLLGVFASLLLVHLSTALSRCQRPRAR